MGVLARRTVMCTPRVERRLIEPRREKTGFLNIYENKGADQRHRKAAQLISSFVFAT